MTETTQEERDELRDDPHPQPEDVVNQCNEALVQQYNETLAQQDDTEPTDDER